MTLGEKAAQQIDEKRERANELQKMFNEWVLENKEDLFRKFMEKDEVKSYVKEIQT